jgi:hypothetical protein
MILVIKHSKGAWDDYYEWVDSVWSIRKKNFNLEKAYQDYLLKLYTDAGLPVLPNKHDGFDFSLLNKGQFKQLSKIAKSINIQKYLKEVLKAKQLDFQDITL